MKNQVKRNFQLATLACCFLGSSITLAQEKSSDTTKVASPKAGKTTNVMLNASSDNGPRVVNIGLPKSVGGTVVLENGLPVTYDFMGQMPTSVWRQDNGVAKFKVLNVSETALLAGDVGVSVSTWTNRGTDKTRGTIGFNTNSFGLLRGDVSVSGPIKDNWFYSATIYSNLDPGTFRSNVATFLDNTQILKFVLNKKYASGQVGVQYKFAESEGISAKQSPYIYHKDGSVSPIDGFRIGLDSYLEQSGKIQAKHPLTGELLEWDAMKDSGSTSHVVDIFGDHKLANDIVVDYTLRYQYANSGMYNPYLTSISQTADIDKDTPAEKLKHGDKVYFYADDPNSPYKGFVQNGMMIFNPRSEKNTIMGRLEFSKKADEHNWMIGLHNWFYNVDKATSATYAYQFDLSPNPRTLGYWEYIANDENGNTLPVGNKDRKWKEDKVDAFGHRNYNAAMQYYNGNENKLALVATDNWNITDKINVDAGMRLEQHNMQGDWYPGAMRSNPEYESDWVSGPKAKVKDNWFNTSFTANVTWKAFQNFGFLADAYYLQQSGKLSLYSGADDPNIDTSEIPGFALGVYYNHPKVSLVSKATSIKRTNFKNNSTFNSSTGEVQKQTISYGVKTIGWTTDILLTPAKGFNLHLLLTLQNPEYQNYEFDVFGTHYSNSGNVARSVSKTIAEIDPSYSFGKFRLWASARYFSKEYANYPNTLIFKERWETFAGLDFKYDKNVSFSLSAVNLLQEKGAQGSISGTNTTTPEQALKLYDKPLVGTYIRPFTVEFKTKIRF